MKEQTRSAKGSKAKATKGGAQAEPTKKGGAAKQPKAEAPQKKRPTGKAAPKGDATPATPEPTVVPTAAPKAKKAPSAPAPAEPTPAPERGGSLPAVGTILRKLDRHGAVRSECEIVEGGVKFKGTVYPSLSAAGLASSRDLGLKAPTINGWTWWGLKASPAGGGTTRDPIASLASAWAKYHERAVAQVALLDGDQRAKLHGLLKEHATAAGALAASAGRAKA